MAPRTSPRREALRAYIREVAKDLIRRGMIRAQTGQSIDTIVKAEIGTIVGDMREDMAAILTDLGTGFLDVGMRFLGSMFHR